jgi:superfamily II DNA or RNA helicase
MTATLSDDVCDIVNEKCLSGKAAFIKSSVALSENISKLNVKNVPEHKLQEKALEVLGNWINEGSITRILVSCSASTKLAEELESKVRERFGKGRKLETFVVTSKTEENHRLAAISKFQSDIDEEDKTIYVVFATEIFSSGVDCVVQAVLSVGGTYSVAECFQLLGRLGRRHGLTGFAMILYTETLWRSRQIEMEKSSDQILFSEL